MPRGYPDWFGQPQFPKYGSARYDNGSEIITEVGEKTILEVITKGRTYGGMVYVYGSGASIHDTVHLYVDGKLLISRGFDNARDYNFSEGYVSPLILAYYDTLTPHYAFNINRDITFDLSFKVTYSTTSAQERDVFCFLFYSEIK
jgi:hypothetical protein